MERRDSEVSAFAFLVHVVFLVAGEHNRFGNRTALMLSMFLFLLFVLFPLSIVLLVAALRGLFVRTTAGIFVRRMW